MSYSYVTLLTSESYLPGALVLAKSLKETGTPHAITVLVSEDSNFTDKSLTTLYRSFDKVILVSTLQSGDKASLTLLGRPELGVTFTKIHVFNPVLLPFEKIVFLDADTLVLKNVDHLFTYVEGQCDPSSLSGTSPCNFAAAPDVGWPDSFNSGVFVTIPDATMYQELLEFAQSFGSFDGGDQGLLNAFFPNWASGRSSGRYNTARLPFLYNVTPSAFYSYAPAFAHYYNSIFIVHFIGELKPWGWHRYQDGSIIPRGDTSKQMLGMIAKWWSFFDKFHVSRELSDAGVSGWTWQNEVVASDKQREKLSTGNHMQSIKDDVTTAPTENFSTYKIEWNDQLLPAKLNGSFGGLSDDFSRIPGLRPKSSTLSHSRGPERTSSPSKQSSSHSPETTNIVPGAFQNSSDAKNVSQAYLDFEKRISGHAAKVASFPPSDFNTYKVSWNPQEVTLRSVTQNPPALMTVSSSVESLEIDEEELAQDPHLIDRVADTMQKANIGSLFPGKTSARS